MLGEKHPRRIRGSCRPNMFSTSNVLSASPLSCALPAGPDSFFLRMMRVASPWQCIYTAPALKAVQNCSKCWFSGSPAATPCNGGATFARLVLAVVHQCSGLSGLPLWQSRCRIIWHRYRRCVRAVRVFPWGFLLLGWGSACHTGRCCTRLSGVRDVTQV